MRWICTAAVIGSLATGLIAAPDSPPALMPGVSEVQWADWQPLQEAPVIVLPNQPTPQDEAAARLLAQYVQRRFGQEWKTARIAAAPPAARARIFLGEPKAFPELAALCTAQKLSLPTQQDGYALKVWAENGVVTALVAGTNGRGVIYGQDTLFQLFTKLGDSMLVQGATIRDWPSIPLRGRPHPHFEYFYKPENFDCIMSSRLNFIDLRDGIYAFEPGAKLKHEELRKIVQQARDRGLRVYAAVNCGVPASEQEAVIALFKEFIALGTDGLWASFDDRGAGEDPVKMVERVLALGREHDITGDAIAITPPKGDYQVIDTKFNRKIVAVPGMEQAVWYWTSIPGPEDAAAGEAIGLRVRPSWWHNWPRLPHPSLHTAGGQYVPVVSLADGWNHPDDQDLRQMAKYVHAIMPWDGWQAQQNYLVPTIGWWSWRPEQHDFQAVRRRIYDMVFGPAQVETAMAFDDILNQVQDRFQFWSTHTDYAPQCPPRLKSLEDRGRTVSDLEVLKGKLAELQKEAPSASLIDRETLQREYLDAMTREVATGLAAAQAPYPEYWWQAHQDAVSVAIYDGDMARADRLIASVRDRVLEEIAQVDKLFAQPAVTSRYAAWWRERAGASAADWRTLFEKRQAELPIRIADYSKTVAPISQMLGALGDPPIQFGTGAWRKRNRLLATVDPEPRELFWGDWIGGVYRHDGRNVAAFALEKHLPVNAGVHTELPYNIPVSGRRDRLVLLVYLADANKEVFGLGRAKWRWSGYRYIRLLWGDRELWKADIGIPRITGEWCIIPLPELPTDLEVLPLRLRIDDYYSAKNSLEIVYVGPIHLVQVDRD